MNSRVQFIISIIALITSLISIGCFVYQMNYTSKIAYVHNGKLLDKYKGVKEVRARYQKQLELWQANLDTLSNDFRKEVEKFKIEEAKMGAKEKLAAQSYLKNKEDELHRYKYSIEQKAKEEEAKYNEAIVTQMNSFLEEFGKQSEYDYIFGVTENGNIMYSRDSDDITELVLDKMNNKYEDK